MQFIMPLVDAWIGRNRRVDPVAVAAIADRLPAVVVTGGSAGIGLAIGRRFAKLGRKVVLIARDRERLAAAAADLGQDKALPVSIDLTSLDAFEQLQEALAQQNLYLDVLVNNAAVGLAGAFSEHPPADIDALLALDVVAPTRLMRKALPAMLARGSGGVLNVASLAGYTPGPGQAAYYASKAYLIALTESVAWEIGGRGVRMCVVAPGPVETRFHDKMGAEHARYRQFIWAQSPEVVAHAAVRGYTLGQTVVVPGIPQRLLMLGQRLTPHPLLTPIVAWLLGPSPPPAAPGNRTASGPPRP